MSTIEKHVSTFFVKDLRGEAPCVRTRGRPTLDVDTSNSRLQINETLFVLQCNSVWKNIGVGRVLFVAGPFDTPFSCPQVGHAL